ncbi:50S ribosomal protein L25 [Patescibacteria group bacterium]|nr:50S ribosomal protein L25 [Patescibacteria group bacterium]
MLTLNAKIRKEIGKKTKSIKKQGKIPAVVYGPGVKSVSIEVDYEEFRKIFSQTGESSLVSLKIEGDSKERPVLIHEIQHDYVTDKFIHIDFYQASMKQEVEVAIPIIFEGISLAVKDLGGTLVKEIQEIKVKALPQNLPHDVKIDISVLNTFEDEIFVKDLKFSSDVKVLKGLDEIVAKVIPQTKIEEELEEPIEEKVEDVEKVVKEKKEEEVVDDKEPEIKPTERKAQ